jgi:hypothetical protein
MVVGCLRALAVEEAVGQVGTKQSYPAVPEVDDSGVGDGRR